MKHTPRLLIFAILLFAALSLAACDATGAVSIEDLTGSTVGVAKAEESLNNFPNNQPNADSSDDSMEDSSASEDLTLKGLVEDVTANSITINGVTFTVDTTEDLTNYFEAGMVYELEYILNADNSISLVSFSLEDMDDDSSDEDYEFYGMLEDVTENTLTFNGETYTVDTTEDLTTLFTAGEYYEIEYYMNADGTITLDSYSLEDSSMYSSGDDDMYSGSDDSYNDNNNNSDNNYDDNDDNNNSYNHDNNSDDNENDNENNNDDNNHEDENDD